MAAKGMVYNIQRMSLQDGPGLRTTVFFKGCPLRCLWCGNPESQAKNPQLLFFRNLCADCGACESICAHKTVIRRDGKISRNLANCLNCGDCAQICPTGAASISGREYTVDQVMGVIRKDASFYSNSNGGVTFSGGECTMQPDFLMALLGACQNEGYHTTIDTCGQTPTDIFDTLLQTADLFLFDMKHMDSLRHKELTGVDNRLILRNLEHGLRNAPEKIRIRIPLMPGINDSAENITAIATFLEHYAVQEVDVLPCHTFGKSKYDALQWQQPPTREYSQEGLGQALKQFGSHGLRAEVV